MIKVIDSISYITFIIGNEEYIFRQSYFFGHTHSVYRYRKIVSILSKFFTTNISLSNEEVVFTIESSIYVENTLAKLLEIVNKHPVATTWIIEKMGSAKTPEELAEIVENEIAKIREKDTRIEKVDVELYNITRLFKYYGKVIYNKYNGREAYILARKLPDELNEHTIFIIKNSKLYVIKLIGKWDGYAEYIASRWLLFGNQYHDEIYRILYLTNENIEKLVEEINRKIDEIEKNMGKEHGEKLRKALNTRLMCEVSKLI